MTTSTPLIAELYAVRMKSSVTPGDFWYTHFYQRELIVMCSLGEPIKVRLTELSEPEEGCYWSWKKLLDNSFPEEKQLSVPEFHFTGAAVCLVEICFAYGSKAEEARGRGKLVPVRMEVIDENA